jgi:FKBP-type peptidyl-prolyl cis-trans isomerase
MSTRYQLSILTLAAVAGWFASWALTYDSVEGAQEELSKAKQTVVNYYSYAIGLEIGANFHKDKIPLEVESLVTGLRDGLTGGEPKFDEKVLQQALVQLNQKRMKQMIEQNKQFLVDNRNAPGIQVTESGLQYKILKQGNGPSPSASDVVQTHYRGALIDGTEFDSSYARGEPATFRVGGVIGGWTEALQMMKVGDKWQLFLPSELAYKDQGAGDVIPPHATLIFEIELLGIEKK